MWEPRFVLEEIRRKLLRMDQQNDADRARPCTASCQLRTRESQARKESLGKAIQIGTYQHKRNSAASLEGHCLIMFSRGTVCLLTLTGILHIYHDFQFCVFNGIPVSIKMSVFASICVSGALSLDHFPLFVYLFVCFVLFWFGCFCFILFYLTLFYYYLFFRCLFVF